LWDEEIKCLFLRTRNPSLAIIDEFIKKTFGYSPYTQEALEIQSRTKKTLGDFRHKFNSSIVKLVKTFKESQERYND
jgi:hypothetical protein